MNNKVGKKRTPDSSAVKSLVEDEGVVLNP